MTKKLDTGLQYGGPADDQVLHCLVERVAASMPDAVGLEDQWKQITFFELNAKANRLARMLVACGVVRDELVGVHLDRSAEAIIALLAILKAGAAYLPLELDNPPNRTSYMVRDASLRIVVAKAATRLDPMFKELKVVDPAEEPDSEHSASNLGLAISPRGSAYAIYTSGSTGRPKAVIVEHQSIVSRLRWMQAELAVAEGDCIAHKTPLGFDVSVWEVFLPLISGCRMAIAKVGGHRDPQHLEAFLRNRAVTIAHFVPSMLAALLKVTDLRRCSSLRAVVCSGESLTASLSRRFKLGSQAHLHNYYGPTEAAVDVTRFTCSEGDEDPIPIGKPAPRVLIYVLDGGLLASRPGESGELYLGGIQLARGYRNRPRLTAERFVPNPFSVAGERLYKTGDIVRLLPSGNLEFLGRADTQVKVRGHRIELGEIESAIRGLKGITECVVVVRDPQQDDVRLVAYVVREPREPFDVKAARAHLKSFLPEYMIPNAFVLLDAMPLTNNGKLDRNALPDPQGVSRGTGSVVMTPRNNLELTLLKIWEDVLNVRPLSIRDSFFDVGGYSLLVVSILWRIKERFAIDMTIRSVFERPTVEGFAALLALHLAQKVEALSELEAREFLDQIDAVHSSVLVNGRV